MKIPINANVYCADGGCGRSTHLVVNPISRTVTHLAVQERGVLGIERLVPTALIAKTDRRTVYLTCTRAAFADLEPFIDTDFVNTDLPHFEMPSRDYVLQPYALLEPGGILVSTKKRIPVDNLALRRGTRVKASDGFVGRVGEFVIDPMDNQISHIVLETGHWWGQREITIPVAQINRMTEERLELSLTRADIAALPAVRVRRLWT